ncbi:MAG: restriction endonuclease subunit S [Deltaproteobacteria bacterium]|nr:restriction endonuclease subunit S [Deltaproteobacteria bacterium]
MNERYPLPQGWRWVKLGEVCEKPVYGYTASAEHKEVGPKFLRITDIQNGKVDWDRVPYCRDNEGLEKYLLKSGDVLFARTGATTGKSFLITETPQKTIFASYLIRVRTGNNLMSEFLYQFLQSDFYWQQVESNKRGGAQPNMNATLLSHIDLPLPPLPGQKRIVAKIQELMQEIERARSACEKQLEAAGALPAVYLRQIFESEEAEKWERKTLGEVISFIKNGIVAEQNFDGKGFQVTRIETISNGVLDSGKIGWVNLPLGNFTNFKLFKGDILFSHINSVERLGNCAIYEGIPENLYHGMNLLRIKADENILNPYFLLYWLRSNPCKDYYITNARRAIGQASLNQKDMRQIPIRLPTLSIQQSICSELKEKMAHVEKLQSTIQNQQSALEALPHSILTKAFKGEL